MESGRLLWLLALVFSVVLLVQYIELPYGYVLSNLLSFAKPQVTSVGSFPAKNANSHIERPANQMSNSTMFPDHENVNVQISNYSSVDNSSLDNRLKDASPASKRNGEIVPNTRTDSQVSLPSLNPPYNFTSPLHMVANRSIPVLSFGVNTSPASTGGANKTKEFLYHETPSGRPIDPKDEKPGLQKSKLPAPVNSSTAMKQKRFKGPPRVVVPISAMNEMVLKARVSYKSVKSHWPSWVDQQLLNAKALIQKAPMVDRDPHVDVNVYRNFSEFMRSYELMEQTLKVYIYAEGERPIFHQPELNGIYASEGWFMKQMQENKHFVTKNADKAHLFYLPFGSHLLQTNLYVPDSHSRKNLVQYLSNFLQRITTKYRFWNRTAGADHFLVACHDWAPAETSRIMRNSIRALCNADVKGGFQFGKDVSLPETYVRVHENPLKDLGGKLPSQRKILAFFAGRVHGYLRPILLNQWENKDPDMKIFGKLSNVAGQMTYTQYMKSSKYCISAKGYEGYTPRVVEAIYFECVPVIISDNYVPPFFETFNWESFAVFVLEKDIPNLKNILLSIPEKRFLEMQQRVKQVQKHFLWHRKPEKYDLFHMILHSIWYTRVFQMRTGD